MNIEKPQSGETDRPFAGLSGKHHMLLTTFRKDGTPVPTPVECHLVDGRVFFVTDWHTGKARRLRRNPNVTVAPCTLRGAPIGETVYGRVRRLGVEEARRIEQALLEVRPITARLGRFVYRILHKKALFMEVLPAHTDMLIHGTESHRYGDPEEFVSEGNSR